MKKKLIIGIVFFMTVITSGSISSFEKVEAGWQENCDPVWESYSCKSGGVTYSYMKTKTSKEPSHVIKY